MFEGGLKLKIDAPWAPIVRDAEDIEGAMVWGGESLALPAGCRAESRTKTGFGAFRA